MRVLLDTCVLLWLFSEPRKLSAQATNLISDSNSDLFLSEGSYFEVSIKYSIGKIDFPESPSIILPRLASEHGITPMPLTADVFFRLESMPLHHKDPFDRLLVAHAKETGLTLISPDPLLRPYDVPVLWD